MSGVADFLSAADLAQAVDPSLLRHSVQEARLAYADKPLVLVLTDARSFDGTIIWTLCRAFPKDATTARECMREVLRRVKEARQETDRTGEIKVHYMCGPVATFRRLCEICQGRCLSLIPTLNMEFRAPDVVVAAFSMHGAAVLKPPSSIALATAADFP